MISTRTLCLPSPASLSFLSEDLVKWCLSMRISVHIALQTFDLFLIWPWTWYPCILSLSHEHSLANVTYPRPPYLWRLLVQIYLADFDVKRETNTLRFMYNILWWFIIWIWISYASDIMTWRHIMQDVCLLSYLNRGHLSTPKKYNMYQIIIWWK